MICTPLIFFSQEAFPAAQIILDHFHIIQHISRTFVDRLLSYDDALRLDYFYYQDFLCAVHTEDYERFLRVIKRKLFSASSVFIKQPLIPLRTTKMKLKTH